MQWLIVGTPPRSRKIYTREDRHGLDCLDEKSELRMQSAKVGDSHDENDVNKFQKVY